MKAYIVVHYVLDFEQFSGGVKSTRCRATVQPDNHIAVEWWYDEKDGEWRDDAGWKIERVRMQCRGIRDAT